MSFGPRTLISLSMASLEAEDISGRTSAEIERVIYVRVKNFDFLERASGAERQEQWSIKIPKSEQNAGSGSIRVRKSTNLREPGAAIQYVLTSKLDIGTKGSCAETPEQSSLDQFNIFKYLSDKGMLKDRYTFPIEGSDLNWEVDCFTKPGEMYYEWVKIDLEKWPRGKELPALPMEFAEMLDGSEGMSSPEGETKIKELYDTVFLIANTKEPLADYGNTDPNAGATDEDGENKANDQGANPPADGEVTDGNPAKKPDGANVNPDDPETVENPDDQSGDEGDETGKGEGEDDVQKEVGDAADDVSKATLEAFSSAGQVLVPLIPILGPLLTAVHGQRSADLGLFNTSQKTKKITSHIDSGGRKHTRLEDTGAFRLSDLEDAKDYISLLEKAVGEAKSNLKNIDRIDMTLWPQKDGRFGLFNIKTDRNGETKIFTENNPGKLKWFSMSLAGKRLIRLKDADVQNFKFNGRTISCPFNGETVEFDVGQLRHFSYQTEPKQNEFDIVEYNFDS